MVFEDRILVSDCASYCSLLPSNFYPGTGLIVMRLSLSRFEGSFHMLSGFYYSCANKPWFFITNCILSCIDILNFSRLIPGHIFTDNNNKILLENV